MNKFYDLDSDINNSIETLKKGGVILCPTDTIWGISCDATNEVAVEKLFEIKQRSKEISLIILVDTSSKIQQYVKEVPEIAWELIEVSDKPLTIIFSDAKNLALNVIAKDGSIGIRVCNDEFCNRLIYKYRKPIVSTSANFSGEKTPLNFNEISEELFKKVDYVVNYKQNEFYKSQPSSIIKLRANGEFKILRK
ncbi:MAG: threonylcarbamoyl-AMP synthase [Bacteroidetes bacterium GWA2_32_17]|nr:MAG: threonylcarbamoyl-AMP synthase [Bacteroidetes bacterium GWA2_32_17]